MKSLIALLVAAATIVTLVWLSTRQEPTNDSVSAHVAERSKTIEPSERLLAQESEIRKDSALIEEALPSIADEGPVQGEKESERVASKQSYGTPELISLQVELELANQSLEPLPNDQLEDLASRARAVVSRLTTEEFKARRAAGLATIVKPFVPGVPLDVKRNISLFEAFTAEGDVWQKVDLPRDEYELLYVVHEMTMKIEEELEAR